jgi:hypothetical protein
LGDIEVSTFMTDLTDVMSFPRRRLYLLDCELFCFVCSARYHCDEDETVCSFIWEWDGVWVLGLWERFLYNRCTAIALVEVRCMNGSLNAALLLTGIAGLTSATTPGSRKVRWVFLPSPHSSHSDHMPYPSLHYAQFFTMNTTLSPFTIIGMLNRPT